MHDMNSNLGCCHLFEILACIQLYRTSNAFFSAVDAGFSFGIAMSLVPETSICSLLSTTTLNFPLDDESGEPAIPEVNCRAIGEGMFLLLDAVMRLESQASQAVSSPSDLYRSAGQYEDVTGRFKC